MRQLFSGGKGRLTSVAFSPEDPRLLAAGYGGEADAAYVALWDIDAGTELPRFPEATGLLAIPMNENGNASVVLAFSPDGRYLVAGVGSPSLFSPTRFPNPLSVWEVATRRLIRRLNGHTGFCRSLEFSRDGKLMASGSHDGTAILWSTESWKATHTLRNPDRGWIYSQAGSEVQDVAFSPDGKILALASRAGTVQFWDVVAGKLMDTLKGHSSAVNAVSFSPDGRTLASGSTDQTVRLWNVETRRELMQLGSGGVELDQVQTLSFAPDGRHLLAGGGHTAFWSAAPPVWHDSERGAEILKLLLKSNVDFQSRIRMLSENLRLHAALEKLDSSDSRVAAALAATQANSHASHGAWLQATQAFDRLVAADRATPGAWLRTPGLLRLARALLQENRPRDAATLLLGGAGAVPRMDFPPPWTRWVMRRPANCCIPCGSPSTNGSLANRATRGCSSCVPSLPASGRMPRPSWPTTRLQSKPSPGRTPSPRPTSGGFTAAEATRMSLCGSGSRRPTITPGS